MPNTATMPARWIPLLYFGLAHLSLGVAFGTLAFEPQSLVGFFYHPRMLAVVHLVTLGWITSSILGAFYIVGPLALRMPLPAGTPVTVSIRPETLAFGPTIPPDWNRFPATIERMSFRGDIRQIELRGPGDWPITARARRPARPPGWPPRGIGRGSRPPWPQGSWRSATTTGAPVPAAWR